MMAPSIRLAGLAALAGSLVIAAPVVCIGAGLSLGGVGGTVGGVTSTVGGDVGGMTSGGANAGSSMTGGTGVGGGSGSASSGGAQSGVGVGGTGTGSEASLSTDDSTSLINRSRRRFFSKTGLRSSFPVSKAWQSLPATDASLVGSLVPVPALPSTDGSALASFSSAQPGAKASGGASRVAVSTSSAAGIGASGNVSASRADAQAWSNQRDSASGSPGDGVVQPSENGPVMTGRFSSSRCARAASAIGVIVWESSGEPEDGLSTRIVPANSPAASVNARRLQREYDERATVALRSRLRDCGWR
jgi:hypothetical protein